MAHDWKDDYAGVRSLPGGELIGLLPMMYTTGLVVGLDERGMRGRYCYANAYEARKAFDAWDGAGDPPGPWIKYKGREGERLGPGATHG